MLTITLEHFKIEADKENNIINFIDARYNQLICTYNLDTFFEAEGDLQLGNHVEWILSNRLLKSFQRFVKFN